MSRRPDSQSWPTRSWPYSRRPLLPQGSRQRSHPSRAQGQRRGAIPAGRHTNHAAGGQAARHERERTLTRKVREALRHPCLKPGRNTGASRDGLNLVYFGRLVRRRSAARHYFGSSWGISRFESALLPSIHSPSRYRPLRTAGVGVVATSFSARCVRKDISPWSGGSAKRRCRARHSPDVPAVAPYLVEYVRRRYPTNSGPRWSSRVALRVYTTLDPALRSAREKSARVSLPRREGPGSPSSVSTTRRPILAMVGGRDFEPTSYMAVRVVVSQDPRSSRLSGPALGEGVRPKDVSSRRLRSVNHRWVGPSRTTRTPTRADPGRLRLGRTVRERGVRSPHHEVGGRRRQDGQGDGITTPLEPNPAIALGRAEDRVSTLEMASAYGTIAAGGFGVSRRHVKVIVERVP